jgi:hypothetical protein
MMRHLKVIVVVDEDEDEDEEVTHISQLHVHNCYVENFNSLKEGKIEIL